MIDRREPEYVPFSAIPDPGINMQGCTHRMSRSYEEQLTHCFLEGFIVIEQELTDAVSSRGDVRFLITGSAQYLCYPLNHEDDRLQRH